MLEEFLVKAEKHFMKLVLVLGLIGLVFWGLVFFNNSYKNINYQAINLNTVRDELMINESVAKDKYMNKYVTFYAIVDSINNDKVYLQSPIYNMEKFKYRNFECEPDNKEVSNAIKKIGAGSLCKVEGKFTSGSLFSGGLYDAPLNIDIHKIVNVSSHRNSNINLSYARVWDDMLFGDLSRNPIKAEEDYLGKAVKFSGIVDSLTGNTVILESAFYGAQCNILAFTNEMDMLNKIRGLVKGNMYTVNGIVTRIGGTHGYEYRIEIHDIYEWRKE